jgi:hypothetical protein
MPDIHRTHQLVINNPPYRFGVLTCSYRREWNSNPDPLNTKHPPPSGSSTTPGIQSLSRIILLFLLIIFTRSKRPHLSSGLESPTPLNSKPPLAPPSIRSTDSTHFPSSRITPISPQTLSSILPLTLKFPSSTSALNITFLTLLQTASQFQLPSLYIYLYLMRMTCDNFSPRQLRVVTLKDYSSAFRYPGTTTIRTRM